MGVPSLCAVLLLSLCACQAPQRGFERSLSSAWDRPQETSIGLQVKKRAPPDPELSGIYILPTGREAFAARFLLARHAERTIDAQTYILHRDVTGRLFLGALLAAADRGVRVRLLVDDLSAREVESDLAALDAHPSLEVRLFNPFSRSVWPGLTRLFDTLMHPVRLNHRAHNKSFTVDGAITIVGGRNIGDEYFDASPHVNFADLDLVAMGPAAAGVGADFDAYWASPLAVPMAAWPSLRRTTADLDEERRALDEHARTHRDSPYAESVRASDLVQHILAGDVPLVWARAKSVADKPEKATASREQLPGLLLGRDVIPIARGVQRELVLVSPYFVPGKNGVAWIRTLRERDARVRILTNALAATDVPLVHSGYERYRRELLELGVELFELQPTAAERRGDDRHGLFGSSGASLHAKTFVFDRKTLFVGSLNFDPRSVELNTEQGLLVESAELAESLLALFEQATQPSNSYRVALEPAEGGSDARMQWLGEEQGRSVRFTSDPHAGFGKRFAVFFGRILPIEGQL
jgi:putative cardiolipin synthase